MDFVMHMFPGFWSTTLQYFCLVLGSYYSYLYLKSIYFYSRVYSKVGVFSKVGLSS